MTVNMPLPEELPVEEQPVESTPAASTVITAEQLAAMQVGGGRNDLDVDALFADDQALARTEGEQPQKNLRLAQRRRWYGFGASILRLAAKILLPRFVRRMS